VQLLLNRDTSCLGANALSVASIQGATGAERTADAAVAARAGVPLPEGYRPPPAPPARAPLAHPCLAQEEGYSTGLATTFFAADAGGGGAAPPPKGGEDSLLAAVAADAGASPPGASSSPAAFSTFRRCDCPSQRTAAAAPWPGSPALPETFGGSPPPGFGARLTGQVAVARPAAGVSGEGPELFPAASDYHLVCLQHDGAASLSVDGQPVYESAWTTAATTGSGSGVSAGFRQYCAPLLLSPGWHDVDVRYAHASRGGASVLRLFVLDAAAVNGVDVGGTPSYEIVWEGQGKCCTGGGGGDGARKASAPSQLSLAAAAPPPCAAPVDCCRFRSRGKCGTASPAPAALPAATQTPRPTANKNETIVAKPRAAPPAETTPPATTTPPTPPPTPDACSPFARVALSAPQVDVVEAPPSSDAFSTPRANVTISVVVSGVELGDEDSRAFAAAELSLTGTAKVKNAAAAAGAPASLDCSLADASSSTFTCVAAGLALPGAFECPSAPLDVEVEVAATLPGSGRQCPAARASLPGSLEACLQPLCRFYAVDMGFCGSEGLVTDRGRALVVMACSQVREREIKIERKKTRIWWVVPLVFGFFFLR